MSLERCWEGVMNITSSFLYSVYLPPPQLPPLFDLTLCSLFLSALVSFPGTISVTLTPDLLTAGCVEVLSFILLPELRNLNVDELIEFEHLLFSLRCSNWTVNQHQLWIIFAHCYFPSQTVFSVFLINPHTHNSVRETSLSALSFTSLLLHEAPGSI